jgi:hypothetical protein
MENTRYGCVGGLNEAGVAESDHAGQTTTDQQRAAAAPDPARDSIGVELAK